MEAIRGKEAEIGNFEYIQKLGEGGFGEVWLASDTKRGEKVAVKFLHLKHSNPNDIELFKHEFEILAELKQVHLARVFDFGFSEEKEQYYLSTEFCPGKKLLEAIEDKSVDYFEEILVQILTALECIHSQGIIHFDIKPENVLVEEVDGRPNVKLVDFGVAVRLKALPEQFGGTLAFIAPEVLQQSPNLDHRVDLYSLGMLCLFCLTKRLPFIPNSPQDVIDWHRTGTLPTQLWKGKNIPNHLREITEKLIAKNPSERFSNSRVVLNFLNLATGGKYHQAEEELQAQIPIEGPMVERREEILVPIQDHMQKVLYESEAGPLSSVYFITGCSGIGKTRILEELQHVVQLKEISFLKIDCDWNVPSWPKLEKWLNIPKLSTDDLNQDWQTRRRMDGVFEASKKNPLCLLVDDFHKADQEMKDLIHELSVQTRKLRETGKGPPLFILVATEEETEGAVTLPILTPSGISSYLRLVLGESVPIENLSDVLYQYSGGLPLLMVEGLRFLVPHFLRGESLEKLLRPDKIHLLYEDKIKKLKPEEEELLLILSLLFRSASEQELSTILGMSPSDLLDLATNCFKFGLMSGNLYGDPIYRVSSQALALDLIGCLEPERRNALHDKIALGLSQRSETPLQELAYHYARAGKRSEAFDYYQQAGTSLEKEGKISSACDCLSKATDLLEAGEAKWQELTLKVFRLLVLSGDYREAEKFPQKLEDYPTWEREEMKGWFYFKMRKFPLARENYLKALQSLPEGENLHRILIENALGNVDMQEGKPQDAVERFQKTFQEEAQLSPEEREKINNNNLGLSLALLGEYDQAIEFYLNRLNHLGPNKIPEELALLNGIGYSYLQASKYEETITYLNRAMALAEGSGALHTLFSITGNLLTALTKGNRYVEALSILKKMVSYQRRFGNQRDIAYNLLRQGSVYLILGMGEFAKECFQEGYKISSEISEAVLAGWFLLMKGYWEREFSELEKAREYFQQTGEEAQKIPNEDLKVWSHYAIADISYEEGKIEDCRQHLGEIPPESQDEEFETRLRLLKAKVSNDSDPDQVFSEIESQCLKNDFRELRWELYQAWAKSCLDRGAREQAIQLLEKGIQVIEEIGAVLPEEYRSRYFQHPSRKKIFDDLEKARRPSKIGLFSRVKKIFG